MPSATSSPGQPCRPPNTPAPSCLKASGSSQEGFRPGTFRSRVDATVSDGRVGQRGTARKGTGRVCPARWAASQVCKGDRVGQIGSRGRCLSTLLGSMLLLATFRCLPTGSEPGPGLPQHCPPARAGHPAFVGPVPSASWCWALSRGCPPGADLPGRLRACWETLPPASLEASLAGHCSGTASGGISGHSESTRPEPEIAG